MLGTFDMSDVGRYVVSGDDCEAFLWDLFDQVVLHGPSVGRVGATRIIIPDPEGITSDADERSRVRGSASWQETHSRFLCECITQGYLMRTHLVPQDMIYELHALRLLAQVQESTYDLMWQQARMSLVGHQHTKGTPEYREALAALEDPQAYPHDDVEPTHLVNHLRLKKVLVLQPSTGLPPGVLSEAEIQQQVADYQAARERDKKASSDALMRRRPRTPRKS